MQAHYEEYCLRHLSPCQLNTLYGGPGGIRTPVQNTFLFASYNYTIVQVPHYKTPKRILHILGRNN